MTTARARPQGLLGYRSWSCEFARAETGTAAHEFGDRDPTECFPQISGSGDDECLYLVQSLGADLEG